MEKGGRQWGCEVAKRRETNRQAEFWYENPGKIHAYRKVVSDKFEEVWA